MEDDTLLDETISKINFLFLFSGLNLKSTTGKNALLKLRLFFVNQFIWLNFDLWGGVYWFLEGLTTGQDFLELTYVAPCETLTTMCTIKVLIMLKHEKDIHKLIDKLKNLERKVKQMNISEEKKNIIDVERNYLHLALRTINILFGGSVFAFTITPLVVMLLNYYRNNVVELFLPFLIKYPFIDPFDPRIFPFIYFHQFWSELICMCNNGSADFFFFTCCTYTRIQFKLLQHHITHELLTNKDDFQNSITLNQRKEKFKALVIWHQELFECADMIENIYSNSILLNFISSSLIICLTGFNVAKVTDISVAITFLSMMLMGLMQIFFICIFADFLKAASTEVAEAIYKCDWFATDVQIAKSLLIMQARAQRPCKLTAAGFADVTLNSFMNILGKSWSYFALLQTIYGD